MQSGSILFYRADSYLKLESESGTGTGTFTDSGISFENQASCSDPVPDGLRVGADQIDVGTNYGKFLS